MPFENPRRFDPATQQRKKRKHYQVKEWMCGEHRHLGWLKGGEPCPRCAEHKQVYHGPRRDIYAGWYEHIDSKPIWCDGKVQLYKECAKRGLQARALMSGGEMKRPKGA